MVTVLLGALSVALTLGGNAFAVVDVARERYCPVPVSWAGWAVLMLEGGGGTLAGSVTSALYVLACAAGCFAVAILALRIPRERREDPVRLPGSWPLVGGTRLDWICGPAAAGFLIVLAITRNPAWAVAVTIAADLILYVPTYGHGWRHPHDEAPLAYGLFSAGAVAAIAAAVTGTHPPRTVTVLVLALAYPLYLAVADGAMAGMVLARLAAAPVPAVAAAVVPGPRLDADGASRTTR
jgi:hypothetical protein